MRVIVVGAGVVGCSAAYRLAQAGADVLVIEAERVGAGTSGTSYAWTNAHRKPPLPYHVLNREGMRLHKSLSEEFPGVPWHHAGGNLEWVHDADRAAQQANIAQLESWGYAVEWPDAAQVAALEPHLELGALGGGAAYFPDEGWADPIVYCQTMLDAAIARHGARIEIGVPVASLATAGDLVIGVRLRDGTLREADTVVNCAGRWVNDAAGEAAPQLPTAPTRGLLVFTPPVAFGVSRVVHAPDVNLRPDGAGRMMLHSDQIDTTLTPDTRIAPDMPQALELVARARRILPKLGAVAPEAVRLGIRPIPGDGFTAVGPMPRAPGYYIATTHSGVTMSPFLGVCIADEVVRGIQRPELADFRPARFFN